MTSPQQPRVVTGASGGPAAVNLRVQHAARLKRYQEYQAFYEGRHYERPRNGRTNLVLNYARPIVSKGIAYLLGRGIGWSVRVPGEESQRSARRAADVEQLLYDVGRANHVTAVDHHVAENAAVLGDGVYKVLWSTEEQRVRIVSIDPRTFFPVFAGDDPSVLRRVECCYQLGAEDLALGGYGLSEADAAGLAGAGTVDVVERWTMSSLELVVRDQTIRTGVNPYGVIPFVHVPNLPLANESWGQSDLIDVMPINRELDERVSDQSDVIRFHADPPIIFKGIQDRSDLAVGPGTVWDIPLDAEVKLLEWEGASLQPGEHADRLLRALFEVSETPRTAFGDADGLLTGVALEIQLRPIVQKTMRRRLFWERALRERARLVLLLSELFGGAKLVGGIDRYQVHVVWPPMLPKDDAVEVRNQVALVGASLRSHRTAMDALGTENPEEEIVKVNEDRATLAEVSGQPSVGSGQGDAGGA